MVTLRRLQYLAALAETLHFGRAAARCAVTQPALSTQIRGLENSLGATLVERRPSGVVLTAEGLEIARRAREILASVRDLTDYARHVSRTMSGPLRLGAIPSIAPYILPRALPAITSRFPELSLSLRESITDVLVSELLKGDLDVLLVALPVGHGEVETQALFEDRFRLVIPASEVKPGGPVTVKDLADKRLLLLEEGHCLRDQALSVCAMAAPDALSGYGASSLATLTQMVANGLGVTLVPELAIEAGLVSDLAVHVIEFAPPVPSRTIGLSWRSTSPQRDNFLALAGVLREIAAPAGIDLDQPAPRSALR